MNYRHAYHAGNHADVLKHATLVRILEHLRVKEAPFAVLDAHAGTGLYDLSGIEAGKTFEWHDGIGRLGEPLPGKAEELLAPYLAAIDKMQPGPSGGRLRFYAGSPELVARLSRYQDLLYFNELHPEDHRLLEARYAGDARVKTFNLDAVTAIKATLPFSTGRGLVLIDPPFEKADEVQRVEMILESGLRRMAHAIFAIWYPIKDMEIGARLSTYVRANVEHNALKAEVLVRPSGSEGALAGSGIIVINPPWKLADELIALVPELAKRLAVEKGGRGTVEWIAPPK